VRGAGGTLRMARFRLGRSSATNGAVPPGATLTSPRSPRASPRRLPPDAPEPEKRRAILHAAVRVFAEQWAILLAALKAIQEGPGSSSEKIAGVIGFVLDVFKTAPTAVRVLILEVARTPRVLRSGSTPETFFSAIRIIADVVKGGQDAGELRGDLEPVVAATGILGALEMTVTGLVVGLVRPERTPEEQIDAVKGQLVTMVLAGLRAPGPSSR